MTSTISKEQKGKTLHVYIQSTKKYPVLQQKTIQEFAQAIRYGLKAKDISYIIVSSKNRSFCAGLDVNELAILEVPDVAKGVRLGAKVLNEIENSDKFFIAAVDGYCVGGGFEFVMAFDHIIATRHARFALPEINIGIVPTSDGIKRLVRHIGKRKAAEMLYESKIITAKEALRSGLINEIVPRRKLLSRSEDLIKYLETKNPSAVSSIKKLTRKASENKLSEKDFKTIEDCLGTDKAKSAIRAFLDRKKS